MYSQGRGVSKDLVQGYKWLALGAQGAQGPQREQFSSARDALAKSMTRAQIDEALQLMKEWTPRLPATYMYAGMSRLGERSATTGGQVIEVDSFKVDAPAGDGWNVQVDRFNSIVTFTRGTAGTGLSTITVQARPFKWAAATQSAGEIVSGIDCDEEATLRMQGAAKSYSLDKVDKKDTAVGEKNVHVMTYSIIDRSLSIPVEVKYAAYTFLPSDWKQRRRAYLFVLGQAQKAGEPTLAAEGSDIQSVIGSFREK